MCLYHREMQPKDADGMANTDHTAPARSEDDVWYGSTLFAQACLSKT